MHIHILGIAGTFMAGIAQIARAAGAKVTGADKAVYPPTSTLLEQMNIKVVTGYNELGLESNPDLVIVGNAMRRGMPVIEWLLNQKIPYTSGPQWLKQAVLQNKTVIAVAGTHGKTSTTSMITWIFEQANLNPSFLIGGKPGNFDASARLTDSEYFIIEADEYDTAFFDKRSKFLHYLPHTFVINNLEFDHADIFGTLADIQRQFHHVIRTIGSNGAIIHAVDVPAIDEVISQGCWTPCISVGSAGDYSYHLNKDDGSEFSVIHQGRTLGQIKWPVWGEHNVQNALSAIAVAEQHAISFEIIQQALASFVPSARRMELKAEINGITIYDDFAHHPTAIKTTLAGLQARYPKRKIIVALELCSYTMRSGFHLHTLGQALSAADALYVLQPQDNTWDITTMLSQYDGKAEIEQSIDALVKNLSTNRIEGDIILVMSNGAFGGIHPKLQKSLSAADVIA